MNFKQKRGSAYLKATRIDWSMGNSCLNHTSILLRRTSRLHPLLYRNANSFAVIPKRDDTSKRSLANHTFLWRHVLFPQLLFLTCGNQKESQASLTTPIT